jgi:hypothetical protein
MSDFLYSSIIFDNKPLVIQAEDLATADEILKLKYKLEQIEGSKFSNATLIEEETDEVVEAPQETETANIDTEEVDTIN